MQQCLSHPQELDHVHLTAATVVYELVRTLARMLANINVNTTTEDISCFHITIRLGIYC